MTPTPFLTDEEIEQMCRGLKQHAAKIRYLRRLGFRVERRPDGSPLVLRSTAQREEPAAGTAPRWTR